MTNESALLGLLAELYAQRETLRAENMALRQQIAEMKDREARNQGNKK